MTFSFDLFFPYVALFFFIWRSVYLLYAVTSASFIIAQLHNGFVIELTIMLFHSCDDLYIC